MNLESALEAGRGIIDTSTNRALRNEFTKAIAAGRLVRLFPRILVPTELARDPLVRARAALVWRPDLVLTGAVAARVGFWPECPVRVIEAAGRGTGTQPSGIQLSQRSVPTELRRYWEPGQIASPAHAIFDLAADGEWAAMCEALRRSKPNAAGSTLRALETAAGLLRGHPGLATRTECLARAARNPWSVPEMELHLLLLAAGLTDWLGNHPLYLDGRKVIPDVVFADLKVAIEVDSRAHHEQQASFAADRARHNLLTAHGWRVLHFTPQAIRDQPELVVAQILATLTAAAHDRSHWR